MFCQVQAEVQTEEGVVVFQCFIPMCGKQALETNFHTQKLFHGTKLSAGGRAVLPTNSGGFDLNELRVVCRICGTNVTHLAFTLSIQNE